MVGFEGCGVKDEEEPEGEAEFEECGGVVSVLGALVDEVGESGGDGMDAGLQLADQASVPEGKEFHVEQVDGGEGQHTCPDKR